MVWCLFEEGCYPGVSWGSKRSEDEDRRASKPLVLDGFYIFRDFRADIRVGFDVRALFGVRKLFVILQYPSANSKTNTVSVKLSQRGPEYISHFNKWLKKCSDVTSRWVVLDRISCLVTYRSWYEDIAVKRSFRVDASVIWIRNTGLNFEIGWIPSVPTWTFCLLLFEQSLKFVKKLHSRRKVSQ